MSKATLVFMGTEHIFLFFPCKKFEKKETLCSFRVVFGSRILDL
jgi:hypothetical protein